MYRGNAICTTETTQLLGQAGTKWTQIGNSVISTATANLTLSVEQNLYGRVIVPPGGIFNLQGICGTAGSPPKGTGTVIWHEVSIPYPV
jgi:hypothetical protein